MSKERSGISSKSLSSISRYLLSRSADRCKTRHHERTGPASASPAYSGRQCSLGRRRKGRFSSWQLLLCFYNTAVSRNIEPGERVKGGKCSICLCSTFGPGFLPCSHIARVLALPCFSACRSHPQAAFLWSLACRTHTRRKGRKKARKSPTSSSGTSRAAK